MDFYISEFSMRLFIIVLALSLDIILGDPVYRLHPVRIIGTFVFEIQKILFKVKLNGYFGGLILWIFTVSFPLFLYFLSINMIKSNIIKLLMDLFLIYSFISYGDLMKHVINVYNALKYNELSLGREAISLIVGRDTSKMNRQEISKAAVETLAESSSDGIIAPLFWALVFGAPGIILYKSVNTLDSMVGYKNEKYLKFGYFSAKADDLFNLLPARITSLIILNFRIFDLKTFKRFWRSRYAHLSPNSAFPESALAALMDVKMGGSALYSGVLIEKEIINSTGRDIIFSDIHKACKIIRTRIIGILIFLTILILLTGVIL